MIGEDKSERLDKVPAILRVIVTRRPKYGCKCEEAVVQSPAPPRLIEGGIPTEALVADVVVSKYADHLPLCRAASNLHPLTAVRPGSAPYLVILFRCSSDPYHREAHRPCEGLEPPLTKILDRAAGLRLGRARG